MIDSKKIIKEHWEDIYQSIDYTQVFWHQKTPDKSLEFIQKYISKMSFIIDVGCGASFLVDELLVKNYKFITILDTSKTSLEIVDKRISNQNVTFICDDILNFETKNKFDLWHDRAVFHFLLSKDEREKYFEVLNSSLKSGGKAIISTFRVGGPNKCAGLGVIQYSFKKMLDELPSNFKIIESEDYMHITPKQGRQEYIYFVVEKK